MAIVGRHYDFKFFPCEPGRRAASARTLDKPFVGTWFEFFPLAGTEFTLSLIEGVWVKDIRVGDVSIFAISNGMPAIALHRQTLQLPICRPKQSIHITIGNEGRLSLPALTIRLYGYERT